MQRSTDRIRTTHVGSLARPPALLDLMKAAATGNPVDPGELAETERLAVAEMVAWQRAAGLDVYPTESRPRPVLRLHRRAAERVEPRRAATAGRVPGRDRSFPEYYQQYLKGAGAFSFEAANPRHEHVYHVFESVKPPRDAVLLPGVISHATNIVEHPDTIADRILRFAELVGRENVVASADCGFSSQATYTPEIHPTIVWAKFESLAEGARRATARLWP